ncbi:MarR family winged helix-turn-helix transcriptional regulator [Tistrella bauzanensis]
MILKAVNATLATHGLKYPAYAILATLRVEGAPYRLSPSQLQQTMLFSSGGISNLLLRLEKDGLIRRTSDRSDRRGVIVELTDKGVALADVAMADHANTERHLIRMFSQDERAQMADMLARMLVVNADAPGYVDSVPAGPSIADRFGAFRQDRHQRIIGEDPTALAAGDLADEPDGFQLGEG